jgi:hypothetical protein
MLAKIKKPLLLQDRHPNAKAISASMAIRSITSTT